MYKFCLHEKLYIGSLIEKRKDKVLQQLRGGEIPSRTWLLTLPSGSENQLQIFSAEQAEVWSRTAGFLTVVGIAADFEDACEVTERMTADALQLLGRPSPRELFETPAERSGEPGS